jgi:hypothetical protein
MSVDQISLLIYLLLPFAAALLPKGPNTGTWISKGTVATGIRILLLVVLARAVVMLGGGVTVNAPLVSGYPLDILLSLDSHRYGFLLTAEFCFLLAHWMAPASGTNNGMIRVLVSFAQGFCSLLVLSNNAVATGALLLLSGTIFFYLVRFSISSGEEEAGAAISTRVHVLFYLLGVIMIAWGITEFSATGLVFGKNAGSILGLALWLSLLVLAIPLPPWSRWFARSMEVLPEGVSLTLVIFLSSVALKVTSLFGVSYPELGWKQKLFLYCLGMLGCGLSIGGLFAAETRRRMLGCVPSFFFSIVLVAVGVSKSALVLSAYFTCLFIPVFTGLILAASMMSAYSRLQKFFLGFLFVLVVGLPGTPVYQIFSGIGARSLDLGIGYSVAFGLIWFFYFNANVHMCRRIFLEQGSQTRALDSVRIEGAAGIFAGYGIFLMVLVTVVAQIAGRLL